MYKRQGAERRRQTKGNQSFLHANAPLSVFHDAVAQGEQTVGKMDVFYHYAGNLFFQLHIGEIPEAPYAVSGQEDVYKRQPCTQPAAILSSA